jgi:hypothetical protein
MLPLLVRAGSGAVSTAPHGGLGLTVSRGGDATVCPCMELPCIELPCIELAKMGLNVMRDAWN